MWKLWKRRSPLNGEPQKPDLLALCGEILEKLREKFPSLSITDEKIEIHENPDCEYICDKDGIYTHHERSWDYYSLGSLGSFEKNIFGMYIYLMTWELRYETRKAVEEAREIILKAKSPEEIREVFLKYMDEAYFDDNVNLDTSKVINDCFNLMRTDGEWLEFYYVLDDYTVFSFAAKKDDNILYVRLIYNLMLKKKFFEEVVPLIPSELLDSKSLLEFYGIFAIPGDFARAIKIDEWT